MKPKEIIEFIIYAIILVPLYIYLIDPFIVPLTTPATVFGLGFLNYGLMFITFAVMIAFSIYNIYVCEVEE